MTKFFPKNIKLKKYKNVIESVQPTLTIKKYLGLAVFTYGGTPNNGVVSIFSATGLVCFIFWLTIFCFCAYRAFSEDQTILRKIYDTKLRQYGDMSERAITVIFCAYALWKIPFDIGLNLNYIKKLVEIDQKIEKLGATIDHDKTARRFFCASIAQLVIVAARVFSVWISLSQLELSMPIEVILQASTADTLALIITAHICYYLIQLKDRYEIINGLLMKIRDQQAWEHTTLIRSKGPVNSQMAMDFQDKCVSEKIRSYARIYSMLFKAVQVAEDMYGFALVCTLLFCLFYIVLYLFYFMEATATGLFHHPSRYTYFLVYLVWQIAYTLGVIFFNVYCSANVHAAAKRTSFIAHEIINDDISQSITTEMMHLSMQLVHQVPVITACGLCVVDYVLLLEGARSIVTLLVILLQFVMD